MSGNELTRLIASMLGSVVGLVIAGSFIITMFGLPYLAWSSTRSLKRISRELERLNDWNEHREHGKRPGPLGT